MRGVLVRPVWDATSRTQTSTLAQLVEHAYMNYPGLMSDLEKQIAERGLQDPVGKQLRHAANILVKEGLLQSMGVNEWVRVGHWNHLMSE